MPDSDEASPAPSSKTTETVISLMGCTLYTSCPPLIYQKKKFNPRGVCLTCMQAQ
jgi:hypothetical protein